MPVDISLAVEKKTRSPEDEREPAYLVTPGKTHPHRRDERMEVFLPLFLSGDIGRSHLAEKNPEKWKSKKGEIGKGTRTKAIKLLEV
jgi:hypothetical protein